MRLRALEFLIPGDLHSATGGYVYDRSIVAGLRALGWQVAVHELHGSFPSPTADALAHAQRVLADLPDQACVLVDGLALGAMPQAIEPHWRRLALVALIHMPLGSELGLPATVAEARRQQELRALRLVRHVVVTGQRTKRQLESDGLHPSRLSVVEPGVWKGPIAAEGGHESIVNLLCVATVSEGKGHELLVDALAPLAHLPWHLRCAGSLTRSTATVQRLTDQLGRLGLIERVELLGELPHEALSELYAAADLLVLPTLRETYCLAVAESLAHGVPVIGTRTGAIAELVGSAAGLLTAPGDRDGLRAALERALTDQALRSSLRAGALAAREHLILWPEACTRMARLLERVCARGAAAARPGSCARAS